jgi:predicted amidohydrolase
MSTSFPDELRVLGMQIANVDATTEADRDANLAAAVAAIRAHPGHDVYLLPEMSAVGYSDDVMRAVAAPNSPLVEDAETGPSCQAFAPLARELGCFIVFGFPRRDASGDASGGLPLPTISQSVHYSGFMFKLVFDF